jgi:1-aminocyclopropane-1-carboxylate deaminase/D-cysteine desulfhydrase-like pyridoxal-dependent ACC family enzyme
MLQKFERYPLTFGPTPIERLSRLSQHLGGTCLSTLALPLGMIL